MSNYRPIKKSCWINFLKSKGCQEATGSRHIKWKCPGCFQSIIFRNYDKEIPFSHISTNLKTMDVDAQYFLDWVKDNC